MIFDGCGITGNAKRKNKKSDFAPNILPAPLLAGGQYQRKPNDQRDANRTCPQF